MAWRPHVSEYFCYDITLDLDIARLSMADEHGREYFARVPSDGVIDGLSYADRRDAAAQALYRAIRSQKAPGEVEVSYDAAREIKLLRLAEKRALP